MENRAFVFDNEHGTTATGFAQRSPALPPRGILNITDLRIPVPPGDSK